jgi:dTDP-glucose 4,6-dehydratase
LKVLVTGGAGFIGSWVVKKLLEENIEVVAIDDFSNSRRENIESVKNNKDFTFIKGDIRAENSVKELFMQDYDVVYHLAAEINVQKSLDDPRQTFERDIVGTFNILEECRKKNSKFIFISTCMVYDRSFDENGISEKHPVKPTSPYAAAKLSGENLTLSYYFSYDLPTVVLRPFNTYGAHQKTDGEGGVVAIFIKLALAGQPLKIFGDGTQTRDLLYVEDCVNFIIKAGNADQALGQIINAGSGKDISINELALLIAKDENLIKHVPHIHPQSEIMKLKCNYTKARQLLNWKPKYPLEEGIELTKEWIKKNPDL